MQEMELQLRILKYIHYIHNCYNNFLYNDDFHNITDVQLQYFGHTYEINTQTFWLSRKHSSSAGNGSWPSALFQPISTYGRLIYFGRPKLLYIFSWRAIITTYKKTYLQNTANQFLILISTTGSCVLLTTPQIAHGL